MIIRQLNLSVDKMNLVLDISKILFQNPVDFHQVAESLKIFNHCSNEIGFFLHSDGIGSEKESGVCFNIMTASVHKTNATLYTVLKVMSVPDLCN